MVQLLIRIIDRYKNGIIPLEKTVFRSGFNDRWNIDCQMVNWIHLMMIGNAHLHGKGSSIIILLPSTIWEGFWRIKSW